MNVAGPSSQASKRLQRRRESLASAFEEDLHLSVTGPNPQASGRLRRRRESLGSINGEDLLPTVNVAGPGRRTSRRLRRRRENVESTYEDDLLGLVGRLNPDEIDNYRALFERRMQNGSSDYDIAMINLLRQARELATIDEDRALAQRIADGEGMGTQSRHSVDEEEVRTETEESDHLDAEDIGAQSTDEEGSDHIEYVVIETEDDDVRHGALRSVISRITRFLLRRGWVSSLISRLSRRKPVLAHGAHAAVPTTRIFPFRTGHDCVACQDPIHGVEIRAPCGHHYDISCVTSLFQSATRDETLFPPRCCGQNIPFTQVQPHLSRAFITRFQQKGAEFSTLKRVYCSSPTCSRFLGPVSDGARIYTCPTPGCHRRTCANCRERHSGNRKHVCRPDAGAAQVLELSRARGWARCPGCSHMIELHLGCFHTTCRCGTEFCYLCRELWKTCDCPQWDEDRLVTDRERADDE